MSNTVIALKKSDVPYATPASLANGELAINYADGKLFYKNAAGYITEISGGGGGLGGNFFGAVNAAGTFLISRTSNDILTIKEGDNINITPNAVGVSLTIAANLSTVYALANAAFDKANIAGGYYTPLNSNTTLVSVGCYVVNTMGGPVTITMPAGSFGDSIRIADGGGDKTENNIIVRVTSGTVNNSNTDFFIDVPNTIVEFIYTDVNDWKVFI